MRIVHLCLLKLGDAFLVQSHHQSGNSGWLLILSILTISRFSKVPKRNPPPTFKAFSEDADDSLFGAMDLAQINLLK